MRSQLPSFAISLAETIEDSQQWLSDVLLALFYDGGRVLPASSLPPKYTGWIAASDTRSSLRQAVFEGVQIQAEKLNSALQAARKNSPPDISGFQNFIGAYGEFMRGLLDIQKEFLVEGHDLDVVTGFKSSHLVMPEMKREFERRGRHGNPFSVIALRVDSAAPDMPIPEAHIRQLAAAVNKSLRGFDDAYRLSEADVLISLKLSDIKGGLRFVERLKAEMKSAHAEFTFSSCVAEPDPASDLSKFLKDLETDLSQVASHGGDQTVKFEEISPMQRFIASMKEKS